MSLPSVLSEDETLDAALAGRSLARFGDGELRLALGGSAAAQRADPHLAQALRAILAEPAGPTLACIPNFAATRRVNWKPYAEARYAGLYRSATYGSAFITRPDSAPWIDRPDYWAKIRALWEDRDVTLVLGTLRSLRPLELPGAHAVREVWGPRADAWADVDRLAEEVGRPSGPVLLCLGPTATVLAERLARRGVWAIDVGHVGMFLRHAGSYALMESLISPGYRDQLVKLRARQRWGGDGAKHAAAVEAFAEAVEAESILDYGCGEEALAAALKPRRVMGYDPGIAARAGAPKPADLVVCTDVLEHVEPDCLDAVLAHIYRLAAKAAYLVIATRPARTILPDGRNAHLIVQPGDWWRGQVARQGWRIERDEEKPGRELRLWLRK